MDGRDGLVKIIIGTRVVEDHVDDLAPHDSVPGNGPASMAGEVVDRQGIVIAKIPSSSACNLDLANASFENGPGSGHTEGIVGKDLGVA